MSIINFGTREVSSNKWGEIMRESPVRFRADGWKLVGRDCLQYEKNTGYCATSFATATRILADQCLRKSGGHRNGFKNAVMARKTIEDAWFSEKNPKSFLRLVITGHCTATQQLMVLPYRLGLGKNGETDFAANMVTTFIDRPTGIQCCI